MTNQRRARVLRRDRHEDPLQKLQRDLHDSGTQDVLDSLPAPDSFVFHKTRKNGHDAIKLLLGSRPNANGSPCQAWARIIPAEQKDLQPPVLFYDQESSADGSRSFQYPRSASSLLRKATELQPPFCFLQCDLFDEATKAREMLSAVILYQAAVTGADACGWQWDRFTESLFQALRYIESRDAYHQWRHEQTIAALRRPNLNNAKEADVGKESEKETDHDQSDDPVVEEMRTSSSLDNNEYPGGTVRSRGSAVVIRANTSLALLKDQLGESKFILLDNIPSKPMTISRHSLGGTFFPFRMLIGEARYEQTGETIDVYAYLDHEGTKGTSIYFLSHDSAGLEQAYSVNHLAEGVNLIEPFEYLNNLKKESYKNGVATSARTAKMRSLICYYFFIAENEGLIGDPQVRIGDSFSRRLCAVCKELDKHDFGSPDNSDGDEDENGRYGKTNAVARRYSPVEQANGPEENDIEFTRREQSDKQPSRIVRLKIQPEILGEIIRSGPMGHGGEASDQETPRDQVHVVLTSSPREDALVEDAPTLELKKRPSSRVTREGSQPVTSGRTDLMNACDTSADTACIEVPSTLNTKKVQTCSVQATTDPGADEDRSTSTVAAPTIIAAGRAAETTHPDSVQAAAGAVIAGHRHEMSASHSLSRAKITEDIRAMDQTTQNSQPGDAQNDSSDKFVPMDISSPAPRSGRSRASSIPPNMSRSNSVVSDVLLHGHVSSLLATQVNGNRPPTPEGSTERDLKSRIAPASTLDVLPKAPAVIDLIVSDDEDENVALPPSRGVIDRTPEAENQHRKDFVDLTQLSSSPKRKKRKSGPIHLCDSEDDIIAGTDGSEWRRKSRSRRK